jgi:starch phosphorylase
LRRTRRIIRALMTPASKDLIAYFSMEIALASEIPTYSGGLGVLAGDTLRSAADMGLPMVAMTLLYRKGYFRQVLDAHGHQSERDVIWAPELYLERLPNEVQIHIQGRDLKVGLWRYRISGVDGHHIPVYLLDTDLEGNHADDRRITDHLYAGEERYRLTQEAVLGIAGRQMLEALGLEPTRYHMNEGHSSLLAIDLLKKHWESSPDPSLADCLAAVRKACVFTTHTPIPAGHDRFPRALTEEVFGHKSVEMVAAIPRLLGTELNMSVVGLELSGFVNGVALRHAEVSRGMFPGHEIHAVTNGVHSATWTSPAMQAVFATCPAGAATATRCAAPSASPPPRSSPPTAAPSRSSSTRSTPTARTASRSTASPSASPAASPATSASPCCCATSAACVRSPAAGARCRWCSPARRIRRTSRASA